MSPLLPNEDNSEDYLIVLNVVTNSPAELAGLQIGDQIMEAKGPKGTVALNPSMGAIEQGLDRRKDMSLLLSVKRGTELLEIEITPEAICRASLNVELDSRYSSASASGSVINFTSAFIRSDDHISSTQFAIAHELAHIVENHQRELLFLLPIIWPIDTLGVALRVLTLGNFNKKLSYRFRKAREREADYIGLYMLARAEIGMTRVRNMFLRWNIKEHLRSNSKKHPSYFERHVNLEAAWKEIQKKIDKKLPLTPERKGR